MAGRNSRSASFGRHLRVGEEMRHALAEVFTRGEVRDPALDGVSITVTEVRVTPDLRHATAFVLPLGQVDSSAVLDGLARSSKFLRGCVAHAIRLKFMPTLRFELDRSFDYAERIDSILKRPEVARDLDRPASGSTSGERDGE